MVQAAFLFLGWGQIWCQNRTPEASRMRAVVDPHSPGPYRVNSVMSNTPEFQEAFGCSAGQPMARWSGAAGGEWEEFAENARTPVPPGLPQEHTARWKAGRAVSLAAASIM